MQVFANCFISIFVIFPLVYSLYLYFSLIILFLTRKRDLIFILELLYFSFLYTQESSAIMTLPS
ncbi:hypothetical protein D7V83_11380 [bacterium 0.1xD8-71]|nr:hypothetical protein D7V83_11380 [bacterium 0.1xD8-71]